MKEVGGGPGEWQPNEERCDPEYSLKHGGGKVRVSLLCPIGFFLSGEDGCASVP